MDEARVDPEEILRKMKQLEQVQARGHLKIFFGYAAGVGKTYAMLKAAQSAKRHGVDVVVGYVEPHARPDTAALLNGLEQLPTLALSQGGVQVREFDLDGALRRAPQLVLVFRRAPVLCQCQVVPVHGQNQVVLLKVPVVELARSQARQVIAAQCRVQARPE